MPRRHGSPPPRSAVDDPGAAPARQVGERPAREDDHAVLDADEIDDVDPEPRRPGEEAGKREALDDADRACAPDRRELALGAVVEGRPCAVADRARDVPALLHRSGSNTVEVEVAHDGHVAECTDLRPAVHGQIAIDDDPPGAVGLGAGSLGQQARERRGGDAGAPDLRPAAHAFAAAVAALAPDRLLVYVA